MSERIDEIKELFKKGLNTDFKDFTVYFDSDYIILAEADKKLYLYNGLIYRISSYGGEPCTYLLYEGKVSTAIHDFFEEKIIRNLAKQGGTIKSATGTDYDLDKLCHFLDLASDFPSCFIGYIEGQMALEKLKELGATSYEKAVPLEMSGINYLPASVSRSKRLKERLMQTKDGKVYVRIKP